MIRIYVYFNNKGLHTGTMQPPVIVDPSNLSKKAEVFNQIHYKSMGDIEQRNLLNFLYDSKAHKPGKKFELVSFTAFVVNEEL